MTGSPSSTTLVLTISLEVFAFVSFSVGFYRHFHADHFHMDFMGIFIFINLIKILYAFSEGWGSLEAK